MARDKEGAAQRECLETARALPSVAWIDRANSGKVKVRGGWMQLHEAGTPDLIGYSVNCVFIGIEVKDPDKYNNKNHDLSDEQIERLLDIKSKGGLCGVACCAEHVVRIMKGEYVGLDDLT